MTKFFGAEAGPEGIFWKNSCVTTLTLTPMDTTWLEHNFITYFDISHVLVDLETIKWSSTLVACAKNHIHHGGGRRALHACTDRPAQRERERESKNLWQHENLWQVENLWAFLELPQNLWGSQIQNLSHRFSMTIRVLMGSLSCRTVWKEATNGTH
jgi:hypothetical protein